MSETLIACNILTFQKYTKKATEKSPAQFLDTSVMCQNRTSQQFCEMFAEIMRLANPCGT